MAFRAHVKIWISLCTGQCRLPADNPYTKGRRNWNKGVLKAPLLFRFVGRRRTLDMFPLLSSKEINGTIVTVFKRGKIRPFTEHTKTERNTLSLPWNSAVFGQPACPAKTGNAVPAAARWDITKANHTEKIQWMGFSSSQAQLRWTNLSAWQSWA